METVWDVIIIGGGPAGLTAGIYTARHGLKTLLLEGSQIGGRAYEAHWIENYPGFPDGIDGHALMELFKRQATKFGVEYLPETVIGLSDMGEIKMVSTRNGYHQAKAVIIATGVQRKQLSVPGEEKLKGRGVSYCAICDGPFFKEKTVAVIGSGHEAIEDALHLADTATKVYAIPGLKGYAKNQNLDDIKRNPKIQIIEATDITEIKGDEYVTAIKLKGAVESELSVDGVFILLEHVSTNIILNDAGITLDTGGCIIVDKQQQTNLLGVFAAGDCTCTSWQVVTATGEGGKAGLATLRYVKGLKKL